MRNVPHRVVCVLGLDAGEFPRRQAPAGFNLMRRHAQAGDRTIREDDRFLFLESLVAARDVFYLSHVDRDAKSAAPNPPSPLVEELIGFLAAAYGKEAWQQAQSRIIRQHPLHAFAADSFRADKGAPSYDRRWWDAARKLREGWVEAEPFVTDFSAAAMAAPAADAALEWSEVSIDELLAWLRHPARAYFHQQLPLHLHEAERDGDVEAFVLDRLDRYQLADRLLGPQSARPDLERVQREGAFPLGLAGQQAWARLSAEVDALEREASERLGGAFKPLTVEATMIEFADLRVRVGGVIRHLVQTCNGKRVLLLSRPGKIRGIDLARLTLEHTLLGAQEEAPAMLALGLDRGEVMVRALGLVADPHDWLRKLLLWRARGLRQPLAAFRKSAEAFAAKLQDKGDPLEARSAARAIWSGDNFPESADPYNALLARHRGDALLDASFEDFATDLFLPLYAAVGERP